MFYIVPSTQTPHTLSSRASFPSYPSEDFARPHSHHHHRHLHRRTQPYIDDNSFSTSDLYASRQRYDQALAQVRAAEAEYLQAQAQARARAEEQARLERQRALQAAARQRAYEEELARRERSRVLQAKAEAERQRRIRIELVKRQMFAIPNVEATPYGHRGYPRRQPSQQQLQRPRPRQEQDAVKDVLELLYGVTPARNVCSCSSSLANLSPNVSSKNQSTPAPVKRVSFASTPTYSSSVPPTPTPQTPLKPRPSAHQAQPQSDEDAITDFIASLFGAPAEVPKKAAASVSPTPQTPQPQPSASTSSADEEAVAKFISNLLGIHLRDVQTTTKPTKPTPAPASASKPAPAPAPAAAETKPAPASAATKESTSDEEAFFKILSGLFGVGALPQRQPSTEHKTPTAPRSTPVSRFLP